MPIAAGGARAGPNHEGKFSVGLLPAGWHAKRDKSGRVYFANDNTRRTQWEDPRPLPEGWEEKIDPGTRARYYANHKAKTTQWGDPRPPLDLPPWPPVGMSVQPIPAAMPLGAGAVLMPVALPVQKEGESKASPNAMAAAPTPSAVEGSAEGSSSGAASSASSAATAAAAAATVAAAEAGAAAIASANGTGKRACDLDWYRDVLRIACVDKQITPEEDSLLQAVRTKLGISDAEHLALLPDVGIRGGETEFEALKKDAAGVKECVVCLDHLSTHIILPCMHLCLCSDCGTKFQLKECPKCRTTIQAIKKTF